MVLIEPTEIFSYLLGKQDVLQPQPPWTARSRADASAAPPPEGSIA